MTLMNTILDRLFSVLSHVYFDMKQTSSLHLTNLYTSKSVTSSPFEV